MQEEKVQQIFLQSDKQHGEKGKQHTFMMIYILKLSFIAAIGGFLFGYDTGVIGGATLYMHDEFKDITDGQKQTFVSLAVIGAAVGAIFIGPISDRFGRKISIILSDIIFILSAFIFQFAKTLNVLCFGRFLIGLGIGIASLVVPVYLAESSARKIRGAIVSLNVCFITFGQLLAYGICLALQPNWRLMLSFTAIPAIIQLALMLPFMDESPRWLLSKERHIEAENLFDRTYNISIEKGRLEKQQEMAEVIKQVQLQAKHTTLMNLKDVWFIYRKIAFVGLMLQVCQQFSGINTVMYYGPQMMQQAGWTKKGQKGSDADNTYTLISAIPLAAINFVGTIVSVFFIDKLGRRYIMLRTLPGCAFGMFCLAVGIYYLPYYESMKYISGISIIIYIIFFSIGMGPPPWAVNSEIYPVHLRGMGNSISTAANWLSNYLIAAVFLTATSGRIAQVISYCVLGFLCIGSFFFIYFLLPETKNKTTEQIIHLFLPHLHYKQENQILENEPYQNLSKSNSLGNEHLLNGDNSTSNQENQIIFQQQLEITNQKTLTKKID